MKININLTETAGRLAFYFNTCSYSTHSVPHMHSASIIKFEKCPTNCSSLKCTIRPEQTATKFNFLCYSPYNSHLTTHLFCALLLWVVILPSWNFSSHSQATYNTQRGEVSHHHLSLQLLSAKYREDPMWYKMHLPYHMKSVMMIGLCSQELEMKEWLCKKRNCPLFAISLLSFAKTLVGTFNTKV